MCTIMLTNMQVIIACTTIFTTVLAGIWLYSKLVYINEPEDSPGRPS